jgi:hypothetical protein
MNLFQCVEKSNRYVTCLLPSISEQVFPTPVRVGFKILIKADKKLVSICEAYLDPVISIVVLILVVIATILGLIFAATQVYAEGDHLVRVGVNLVNSTVSQHPEINEVLPEGWQSVMDSMAGNAYRYGREYITDKIRDSIPAKDPGKAAQIEKQVIELWDRIYLAWNQTWDNAFAGAELSKVRKIKIQLNYGTYYLYMLHYVWKTSRYERTSTSQYGCRHLNFMFYH